MYKLILSISAIIFISCSSDDTTVSNLEQNLYENNEFEDFELFEKANSPKHSYFTTTDDHMMEFNSELLKEIKNFIEKY